jgi:hypothetical protein
MLNSYLFSISACFGQEKIAKFKGMRSGDKDYINETFMIKESNNDMGWHYVGNIARIGANNKMSKSKWDDLFFEVYRTDQTYKKEEVYNKSEIDEKLRGLDNLANTREKELHKKYVNHIDEVLSNLSVDRQREEIRNMVLEIITNEIESKIQSLKADLLNDKEFMKKLADELR